MSTSSSCPTLLLFVRFVRQRAGGATQRERPRAPCASGGLHLDFVALPCRRNLLPYTKHLLVAATGLFGELSYSSGLGPTIVTEAPGSSPLCRLTRVGCGGILSPRPRLGLLNAPGDLGCRLCCLGG